VRPHGVDVIVIEPGGGKTPIWQKGNELADDLQADMPPEAQQLYGRMIEALRRETVKIQRERGIEAREVAEAIGMALTAKRPRARYLVGRDAKLRGPAAALLPDRVMDRLVARAMGDGRR
jgi:NAD(P)-dependent dehydrogenase (short-subunit alcohol dehydrogenase family)